MMNAREGSFPAELQNLIILKAIDCLLWNYFHFSSNIFNNYGWSTGRSVHDALKLIQLQYKHATFFVQGQLNISEFLHKHPQESDAQISFYV